jgi:catechol 2,3-dioxygenase
MDIAATEQRRAGDVQELGHLVLYVANLERSLEFYRDLLGWPVIFAPGRYRAAGFRAGNTHHDLLLIEVGPQAKPAPSGLRRGMYHFGVKVGDTDDDLRALRDRLETRPDLVAIIGAVDGGFVHSLYVHDPDENEVELYIDVPGWDWNSPDLLGTAPRRPLRL